MSKEQVDAMDFVAEFVKYFDDKGIADKYEAVGNKMVTSEGVYALVQKARAMLPARLAGGEAARTMRSLDPEVRDDAISASERVVDARHIFSKKVAENGGARGLIANLVEAYHNGDTGAFGQTVAMMEKFTAAENGQFEEEKEIAEKE